MRLIATQTRNDFLIRSLSFVCLVVSAGIFTATAIAQQVAFPIGDVAPVQSGVSSGAVGIPQTNLAPVATPAPTFTPPPSGSGQFDPYALNPSAGSGAGSGPVYPGVSGGYGTAIGPPTVVAPQLPNSISPSPPGSSLFSRVFSQPAGYGAPPQVYGAQPQVYGAPPQVYGAPVQGYDAGPPCPPYGAPGECPPPGAPIYGSPAAGPYDNPNVYGPPVDYAAPNGVVYPSTAYPSSVPTTMFPNGVFPNGINADPMYSAYRLLQGPRFRYTYVSGGSNINDLQTNDFDTSVVFAFPNFLYSTQPLYVVPSFSLHLWDGPRNTDDGNPMTPPGGADLPANAYSAFLDIGWQSDANQMIGTELGVRLGIFTDFDTNNSESFRVMGKALASFRCSPTSTFKGGLYYLDRNSIKLVPALGVLWQPNPFTRADIFFPQPKFARYCRTIGTRDVWWYLTGDYGGGSWTIKRTDPAKGSDSIDINDYRAILGFEWGATDAIRAGRRTAFAEIGWVFKREIEYRYDTSANPPRNNPEDNIDLRDGVMFRAGIGY